MKKTLFVLTFFLLALSSFAQADLKVINSDYKDYYVNGSSNTYTITIVNSGPADATNVSISNAIPSGITNFTWTGPNGLSGINTPVADVVTSFAVGETRTYVVNLVVPANFSGNLLSKTVVKYDQNPNPVESADVDTKAFNADIVVTNTDNTLYYTPNTSTVYTVKVTNKGPLDAKNVKVNNPIPSGITQFTWNGTNSSIGSNVPLSNTIPLLKNGETVTYTITVQVPAGYTGNLTSQTTVTSDTPDPNPACTDCTDTDTMYTGADIVVTNTDSKTTYTAGGTNTYTVKVENKGPQDANGVVVAQTLPAGIAASNVSWTGNSTSGSGFLNNTIASLPVGQSVTYTITVQIPAGFVGDLANQISANATTSDPYPLTNQVIDTDTQANATDIVVVNTDNTDIYTPGASNVYKVTVTNNGTIAATAVAVTDVFAGIPQSNITWTGSNGSSGTGNVNNTIASLAAKQTVTYTVTVAVPVGFTGNLTSQVSITSTTVDTDPSCSQCTDVDKIKSGVVVVNTDSKPSYTAGQSNTYTITVTNYDAVPKMNVAIKDLVPAGINPTDFTWSGNGKTGQIGDLIDTIVLLGPNQSVTYTVVVAIPAGYDQKANLVNEVTYSVNGVPNSTVCAECKDTDTPTPFADLQILKTDNQTQFYFNSTNTYTIVITNNGPSEAKNVIIEDKIPPGISVMTWSGNGKSGSGTLNDVIPTLTVGQTVTYIVKIDIGKSYSPVDPSGSGTLSKLTNTVKVTSDTVDPTAACPGCSDVDDPRPDYVTVTINDKNDPNYTENLVKNVLINSPCVDISNFQSTASCGFGYFNRNNSDFPIKEGMIIRCGEAKKTEGKYDNTNESLSTQCSKAGDPDLLAINKANGNLGTINDASSVKFKFVAAGVDFSFKYLFASQEYGQYQCNYSDAFAFILTDVTPGAADPTPHNLAVVPNTKNSNPPDGVPVSVTNVRKNKYNAGCPDKYPEYFGIYNAENATSIAASDINMKGQTKVLTATSKVIPGHEYTIKLVIGDYNDMAYDSAVFIEAGSFDIGGPGIVGPQGEAESLELCENQTAVLRSGTTQLPGITYSWKLNGDVISGENKYFITVSKPGVYTVVYDYVVSGCQQTDDFTVVPTKYPPLLEPNDLTVCEGETFDLSENVPVVLGPDFPINEVADYYDINYFTTDQDGQVVQIEDYTKYAGKEGESINMTIQYFGAPKCIPTKTFKLHVTPAAVGTIQYTDDDSVPGFCRNSNSALTVSKSTSFTEGGVYSVSPATGLTIDSVTGTLNLTDAVPADYVVNYKVAANVACPEYNTTANVKIRACITVDMNPIAAICGGEPVTLTCTDAGSGVVYTWSDASGVLGTTTLPSYTLSPAPSVTGNYTYTVVASYDAENSSPSSEVLTVNLTPVVAISGSASVCSGGSVPVTFTGTPGAFVTYNDGSADSTIQLDANGTYVLNADNLSTNVTYQLVSVAANSVPNCIQNISAGAPNSAVTINVIEAPTAAVNFGSANTLCMGEATDVVFSGTPDAEVVYTKNGVTQSLTLNASGQAKIIGTGILKEDTEYSIVSVTSSAAACVGYPISSILIDVVVIPDPAMMQNGYICVDPNTGETTRTYKLDTGLDPAQYTFEWYFQEDGQPEVSLGSTDNYYECDKVGQYKVIVTDNGPLQCKRTSISTIQKSVPPLGVVAVVATGYFNDNATIVATAAPEAPEGTYEYSLDFGPFQDSNVFKDCSYGPHVVHARDKQACDEVTYTVKVIDFPRYFTPNGDGYNDEWNISVLDDQPNAKIYIFDRFGKLLKQISPVGAGWDGTYNGHPLPATDYWFVVKYQEQLIDKEFKAHFTLKR